MQSKRVISERNSEEKSQGEMAQRRLFMRDSDEMLLLGAAQMTSQAILELTASFGSALWS